VDEVYYIPMIENMTPEAVENMQKDPTALARMLGYALSLQLKFVRRESSKHRIWLRLEEQSENYLKDMVRDAASKQLLSARDAQDLEKKVLQEFAAATVGWHDNQMAALTFVHQENAPNFFDILQGGTGTIPDSEREESEEEEETEEPEPEPPVLSQTKFSVSGPTPMSIPGPSPTRSSGRNYPSKSAGPALSSVKQHTARSPYTSMKAMSPRLKTSRTSAVVRPPKWGI
jgi:hypothetical protein